MKFQFHRSINQKVVNRGSLIGWLGLALLLASIQLSQAAESGKSFTTPEQAVSALQQAVSTADSAALRALFGHALDDLENPDRVQATNEFEWFSAALSASHRLVQESETKYVLELGTNSWPFPVPLVKQEGRWVFDTEAGKDELLSRRIGKNELATLEVMRVYVEAQREYASRDRDGSQVLKFAQRIGSSPGTKDGLYWPPDLDGEMSPLGPLVAEAQSQHYTFKGDAGNESRVPFQGYYFKILTRQGNHAPGGKYNYIINGNMIGGFAMVAWPADYGTSGIMTFIVNQQGRVFQKDLGPKTAKIASAMKVYDPDPSWRVSPD